MPIANEKKLTASRPAGVLDPANRERAEIIAWSSVHGLATLLIDGPIGTLPPAEQRATIDRATIDRVLDATVTGILGRLAPYCGWRGLRSPVVR